MEFLLHSTPLEWSGKVQKLKLKKISLDELSIRLEGRRKNQLNLSVYQYKVSSKQTERKKTKEK